MDTRDYGFEVYANDELDDPNRGVMVDMGASGKVLTPEQARHLAERLVGIAGYLDPDPEIIIAFEFDDEFEPEHVNHIRGHMFCPACGSEDTIVEVDESQRWNRLGEVEIDREPLGDLPVGYRWASEYETEMHAAGKLPTAIVVKRTVDSNGVPYTQDEADVAVPDDRLVYAFASLGDGNYDHQHFLCTECLQHLTAPNYFEIADWS